MLPERRRLCTVAAVRIDVLLGPGELRSMLEADVRGGLSRSPKAIRTRWVWDAHGSELFEQITALPTYDLPRRELSILEVRASEVAALAAPGSFVELGSGSSPRTALLLDVLVPAGLRRYIAVDVSEPALRGALSRLAERYSELELVGAVADFERQLAQIETVGRVLLGMLGSTIGGLDTDERRALLGESARTLAVGDALLLGLDLAKPAERVLATYAHPDELAAGLISNVLPIVNRELGADFDVSRFTAEKFWNPAEERLETVVRSREDQRVSIRAIGLTVELAAGETIRTQLSAKFRRERVEAELAEAGFRTTAWWPDRDDGFAVCLATR
jgi:L-histidine N-alpha-methyltransferase